jgi:hypothetical protein
MKFASRAQFPAEHGVVESLALVDFDALVKEQLVQFIGVRHLLQSARNGPAAVRTPE